MKIIVDMNLSPEWVQIFALFGWAAQHWSHLGKGDASDAEVFQWAAVNDHAIFTQDLDFPQILFASRLGKPSVILLRTDNELDGQARSRVCMAIKLSAEKLKSGAILVIDSKHVRLRELPIQVA